MDFLTVIYPTTIDTYMNRPSKILPFIFYSNTDRNIATLFILSINPHWYIQL